MALNTRHLFAHILCLFTLLIAYHAQLYDKRRESFERWLFLWSSFLHNNSSAQNASVLSLHGLPASERYVSHLHCSIQSFTLALISVAACPYNWTIHNDASNFTFTHPQPHAERLDSFVNPDKPWKTRFRCKTCGCTVASKNSKTNNVSVWGPHLERDNEGMIKRSDEVKPTAHIFYGTRIADVNDGLPKWEGYEGTSNRMG